MQFGSDCLKIHPLNQDQDRNAWKKIAQFMLGLKEGPKYLFLRSLSSKLHFESLIDANIS